MSYKVQFLVIILVQGTFLGAPSHIKINLRDLKPHRDSQMHIMSIWITFQDFSYHVCIILITTNI